MRRLAVVAIAVAGFGLSLCGTAAAEPSSSAVPAASSVSGASRAVWSHYTWTSTSAQCHALGKLLVSERQAITYACQHKPDEGPAGWPWDLRILD